MSIKDEMRDELRDAMRQRDRARLDVIRQIESEVSKAAAEPGFSGEIDDAVYRKSIASFVKRMSRARDEFLDLGETGTAQAAKLEFEIEYLARWLPRTLGEDETRAIVRAAIAEAGAVAEKDAGRMIGAVMRSGQDLDGGLVNRLVREELGGS
jgi:uncharacterized protein YqeY